MPAGWVPPVEHPRRQVRRPGHSGGQGRLAGAIGAEEGDQRASSARGGEHLGRSSGDGVAGTTPCRSPPPAGPQHRPQIGSRAQQLGPPAMLDRVGQHRPRAWSTVIEVGPEGAPVSGDPEERSELMAVTIAELVAVEHAVQEQGRQLVARGQATPSPSTAAAARHLGRRRWTARATRRSRHRSRDRASPTPVGPRAPRRPRAGMSADERARHENGGVPGPTPDAGRNRPGEAGLDVAEIGGGHQQVDLSHPPWAGFWRGARSTHHRGSAHAEPGRSTSARLRPGVRASHRFAGGGSVPKFTSACAATSHPPCDQPCPCCSNSKPSHNRRPPGSAARVRTSTPRGGSRNGVARASRSSGPGDGRPWR